MKFLLSLALAAALAAACGIRPIHGPRTPVRMCDPAKNKECDPCADGSTCPGDWHCSPRGACDQDPPYNPNADFLGGARDAGGDR